MKQFILFLICIGNCFGQVVKIPPKLHFDFCFSAVNSLSSNTDSSGDHSFYDGAMVNGVQATGSNAYISIVSVTNNTGTSTTLPTGWTLDQATGVLTLPPGTLPTQVYITYQICPLPAGSGGCSSNGSCGVIVTSPLAGHNDYVYIDQNGDFLEYQYFSNFTYYFTHSNPNTYNVLSNDYLYNCDSGTIQATISNVTMTPTNVTPGYSFYIDTIINPGNIIVDTSNGNFTAGSSYTLTYDLSLTYPTSGGTPIVITKSITVYISVIPDENIMLAPTITPPPTATAKDSKPYQKNGLTYVTIADPNVKAVLINQNITGQVYNITYTDSIIGDANNDHEIDTDEAAAIGGLNVSGMNVTTLAGLENFPNLKFVAAHNNQLALINTAVLPTSILSLGLYNNPTLTTFDVSGFPNLYILNTGNSLLNTLDLGNNHNFTNLYTKNCPNLTSINIKNGIDQDVTSTYALQDCWQNCPNLTNICVDASELTAVQDYLTNCGGNATIVNSNCAMGTENAVANSFTIAPNPSSGIFEVSFNKPVAEVEVTVYDVMGKKVYSNQVNSLQSQFAVTDNSFPLDFTNYPSGAYFVTLKTGNEVLKQTVIKK